MAHGRADGEGEYPRRPEIGEGFRLLPLLDRRSRACCAAMAGIYRELLTRLAADPGLMMRGRASLPPATKARIALRAFR